MEKFEDFNLNRQLLFAIEDLGFDRPTPIQIQAFPAILSGSDMVGIAQTGTGKTFAYMLPILQELKFSKQTSPRVMILVPTRELVVQLVEVIEQFTKYLNIRVLGVYGGVNINKQRGAIESGTDILVATPGRLYDLSVTRSVKLRDVKRLVIDEVDVMLDLGFRPQLTNIFELLPERRQNIMFSATMTEDVDELIDDYFIEPKKISIAVSGTPLDNITQVCYPVPNFYTKVNLLDHLINDEDSFNKVLVFVSNKRRADRLFESLEESRAHEIAVIHSNKTQNYRLRSIEQFDSGKTRILISTDVMARGLDLEKISHVINFDTPHYPENYMHRIGRTGRAEHEGHSILFYTPKEESDKNAIEDLMSYSIPQEDFPNEVEISERLTPEERPRDPELKNINKNTNVDISGPSFHEKKEKNKKTNQGGSYHRNLAKKYKKPKSRGDKNFNRRNKKK